ncbi:MAG TPA: ABC transporter ATP-binding protein [Candidatus Sulfotelmatobacter sp.]|nr:ABC transporter ATP-binding protein [Candidatus Sulfotelmatobacter sp.]
MSPPLLEIQGLRRTFGHLAAVDDVSLTLEPGVLTAIIGPNGAGKTTLINLLTGLLMPDAGTIRFKDQDVSRLPPHARVRRGLSRSFQIMNVFPNLTAQENILLPALARRGRTHRAFRPLEGEREAFADAEEILGEIGLWEQRGSRVRALSHGDQRRLELGIAVATRPELCFLDEPSSGMNPVERQAVLGLIRRLSAEGRTTFVIVEHDMDVVFSLSQRIVVMNRGQVLADGTPAAIRENRAVRETYLGTET